MASGNFDGNELSIHLGLPPIAQLFSEGLSVDQSSSHHAEHDDVWPDYDFSFFLSNTPDVKTKLCHLAGGFSSGVSETDGGHSHSANDAKKVLHAQTTLLPVATEIAQHGQIPEAKFLPKGNFSLETHSTPAFQSKTRAVRSNKKGPTADTTVPKRPRGRPKTVKELSGKRRRAAPRFGWKERQQRVKSVFESAQQQGLINYEVQLHNLDGAKWVLKGVDGVDYPVTKVTVINPEEFCPLLNKATTLPGKTPVMEGNTSGLTKNATQFLRNQGFHPSAMRKQSTRNGANAVQGDWRCRTWVFKAEMLKKNKKTGVQNPGDEAEGQD